MCFLCRWLLGFGVVEWDYWNMTVKTAEKIYKEIEILKKETEVLKELVFFALKDSEGEYRGAFVRKVIKKSHSKPVFAFTGKENFLKSIARKKWKMEIVYSKDFIKSASSLPKSAQRKLAVSLEKLAYNPFHPQLHSKPLVGKLRGYYSFRITRDWRVIFNFQNPQAIFLIDVAHRKEIYK